MRLKEEELRFYIPEPTATFFQAPSGIEEQPGVIHIVGVPLDDTVSNRPGTRFAPQTLRQISPYIEYTSTRGNIVPVNKVVRDVGDIVLYQGDIEKNIERISKAVSILVKQNNLKILFIGGEHTITYAILRALKKRTLLIYFDAHLDMRDEWPLGQKLSHATHVRRLVEHEKDNVFVINIGARAYDTEEIEYARTQKNIIILTHSILKEIPPGSVLKIVRSAVREFDPEIVYLSIDVDVLDPSLVATSNPEGGGFSYNDLFTLLSGVVNIVRDKLSMVDVVEYNPLVDPCYATAYNVLRIIVDIIDLLCFNSLS